MNVPTGVKLCVSLNEDVFLRTAKNVVTFFLKTNVNFSEMEQFSIITVRSYNLNLYSNLWGSGTDALKKQKIIRRSW